ncbi:MAG: tetratricopeptide repeat protein [Lentisphaeria bacterium]|nr:tetratricopeptide repeat protein [Lentisphaeria bacterium]
MRSFFLLFPVLLYLAAGCSREVPPPPVERNDLVVRFFRSLRNSDGEAAAVQGEKLYAFDKRNYFLLDLVAIQQANGCIAAAQQHLNSGNLDSAIQVIRDGLRRFPNNRELHKQYDRLRKLRHAEKLFIAIRSAPNPAAMNSALIAARTNLSGIDSPRLKKFFADYRKSIDRWGKDNYGPKHTTVKVPIRSFDDK